MLSCMFRVFFFFFKENYKLYIYGYKYIYIYTHTPFDTNKLRYIIVLAPYRRKLYHFSPSNDFSFISIPYKYENARN